MVDRREQSTVQPDGRFDFKPNLGPVQVLLRVIVGTGSVALAATGLLSPLLSTVAVLFGIFFFVQAATRY